MSNSELMLDVGQANEIKLALRREGPWTNEEIKMLCERKGFLRQVREALLGHAEIKQVEHLVDLDADPFLPEGWKVKEHKKGGQFKYDPTKVKLYLSKDQQNDKTIFGNKLCKELESQKVMNANLLDFYLRNPHLIPEEWKGKAIFFWGTIYHHEGGLCVLYIGWGRDGLHHWSLGRGVWGRGFRWLNRHWDASSPSLVLAS